MNDEQPRNDKPIETEYIKNFKNLEKQIHVNEATSKIMEQIENLSVKVQDILMIKEQKRYKVSAHDKSILSWRYQNYKKRLMVCRDVGPFFKWSNYSSSHF